MNLLKNTNKVAALLNWVLVWIILKQRTSEQASERDCHKKDTRRRKRRKGRKRNKNISKTKPGKKMWKSQSIVMSEEIEKVALDNIKMETYIYIAAGEKEAEKPNCTQYSRTNEHTAKSKSRNQGTTEIETQKTVSFIFMVNDLTSKSAFNLFYSIFIVILVNISLITSIGEQHTHTHTHGCDARNMKQ